MVRLEEWTIGLPSAQLLLVALLVGVSETAADLTVVPADRLAAAKLIERLKRLSLVELARVAASGSLQLVVRLDAERAGWSVRVAARAQEERALLEYFVRHGASRALLRELFGASRRRVAGIRRTGRLRSTQGRPRLPSRGEREAIEARWEHLAVSTPDLRTRYRELHQAFPHHTLAALAAVVRHFDSEGVDAHRSPENRSRREPIPASPARRDARPVAARAEVVHRRDRG